MCILISITVTCVVAARTLMVIICESGRVILLAQSITARRLVFAVLAMAANRPKPPFPIY